MDLGFFGIIDVVIILTVILFISSCTQPEQKVEITEEVTVENEITQPEKTLVTRTSLNLNAKQKNHQLSNMRSHLEAIQNITMLLANDEFDNASVVAYEELG
ncbi:MAG: hypothetical protein KAH13_02275, partial [Tenericutes bacterium]|nr:hypothetical protein [Mycoplasmatota bacterium]